MSNIRRKVTLPSLGYVSVNFYDTSLIVAKLYEKLKEFDRQKKINHLGLISSELDGASHSRYDYLMLQCALTDILDKLHKGSSAQGSLKISGKEFKGNGILKSWFLLSNFGHLKNTYGDEKTLILYALRRKGFKTKILNLIKSQALKQWCDSVISNFQYQKFHYVLSIYRIYKEQPRRVSDQDEMAKLMELLLLDPEEIRFEVNKSKLLYLRSLFKKIRDIAIVTIDGHYSHTPISINLMSSLVSFDEIEGGVFGRDISSSLAPLRKLLHEEIYLNPCALARQRSYEVNALKQLNKLPRTSGTDEEIINRACNSGILTEHSRDLTPFCRVSIHPDIQPDTPFYNEFRNITLRVKKGCPNVDAYLDWNPYTKTRYADFFISDQFSDANLPRFLANISSLIKDQITHLIKNVRRDSEALLSDIKESALSKGIDENVIDEIIANSDNVMQSKTWESVGKHLFPLYRSLLWSVISYFIKDNFRIEIKPLKLPYENYSVSFPGFGDGHLLQVLNSAIDHELDVDVDRVHELQMLKHSAKRKYDGFKIACLVRVDILDMTQPPDKMKTTDIDAVLLKISEDSISLELFEAKNLKNKSQREPSGAKELKKLLVPVLNGNGNYQIKKVKNYGAKLVLKCSA